jgi:alanyl-tRNA synthetase
MNKKVTIEVDKEHREKIKRLHTATHIVNYCARKVLGDHVWQNGSNLKPEYGTLDITHFDTLTLDQIFAIEKLANETVFENKIVKVEEYDRTEAEKKFGFVLYQGGAIPMKTLRVVSILDSDIEACGGLHMSSTGGIGFIKIIGSSKIQDGVIRLKYVVRDYAIDAIHTYESLLEQTSDIFSVEFSQIPKTAQKFFDEWKELKKENEKLKKELISSLVESILSSSQTEFHLSPSLSVGDAMQIAGQISSKKSSFALYLEKAVIATEDVTVEHSKKQISKGKWVMHVL